MSTKMNLPMAAMPAVISDSVAAVLRVHGLTLSPELLSELGRNATQALFAIDESLLSDVEEPSPADRFAVGCTLRALAAASMPNPITAPKLNSVGEWLAKIAKADLARKAA